VSSIIVCTSSSAFSFLKPASLALPDADSIRLKRSETLSWSFFSRSYGFIIRVSPSQKLRGVAKKSSQDKLNFLLSASLLTATALAAATLLPATTALAAAALLTATTALAAAALLTATTTLTAAVLTTTLMIFTFVCHIVPPVLIEPNRKGA